MRIVTSSEMKKIESVSYSEYGLKEELIIENIGITGAQKINDILSELNRSHELLFLVGKGNNGSDALAIARHLTCFGYKCRAFVLSSKEDLKKENAHQLDLALNFGVKVNFLTMAAELEGFLSQSPSDPVIVDGVFGTGVRLPLSQFMYDVINMVNQFSNFTISVDIPSGVNGDTGHIQGNAIEADVTLSIGLPKLGYFVSDGAKKVGNIEHIHVGLPNDLLQNGDKFLLSTSDLVDMANRRSKFADKKVYGHSLVLGGSHGLTGAAVLASTAALKVGAGLVTAATWEPQYDELLSRLIPEVMTGFIPLEQERWPKLLDGLKKYSSIILGPGLARSNRVRQLTLQILSTYQGTIILDADAINVLKIDEDSQVFNRRNAPTILTPNMGELARFCKEPIEAIEKNPVHFLKKAVDAINSVIILKGPCTYIALPDGTILFNYSPNDGMATGGVGDVLAGILGGLLSQKETSNSVPLIERYESLYKTICLSVLIHSLAGQYAATDIGVRAMTARSLVDCFPKAFNELERRVEEHFEMYGEQ